MPFSDIAQNYANLHMCVSSFLPVSFIFGQIKLFSNLNSFIMLLNINRRYICKIQRRILVLITDNYNNVPECKFMSLTICLLAWLI